MHVDVITFTPPCNLCATVGVYLGIAHEHSESKSYNDGATG